MVVRLRPGVDRTWYRRKIQCDYLNLYYTYMGTTYKLLLEHHTESFGILSNSPCAMSSSGYSESYQPVKFKFSPSTLRNGIKKSMNSLDPWNHL